VLVPEDRVIVAESPKLACRGPLSMRPLKRNIQVTLLHPLTVNPRRAVPLPSSLSSLSTPILRLFIQTNLSGTTSGELLPYGNTMTFETKLSTLSAKVNVFG
jgi:hypothetical protein